MATVRTIRATRLSDDERSSLRERAFYEGSPLHKRDPSDFGLIPPSDPRPDKTLCDEARIFEKLVAQALFQRALENGVVSAAETGLGYPKQIWVVDANDHVFELMYGGSREGAYHGYPIRRSDPLHDQVREAWSWP